MQVIDLKAQDKDPIFALAYGASGTGKTHFVATLGGLGRVLVIDIDQGIKTLRNAPDIQQAHYNDNITVVSFDKFKDLDEAYKLVAANDPVKWSQKFGVKIDKPFDWIAWDTWSEIQWYMLEALRSKDPAMKGNGLNFRSNVQIQHWGMMTDLNKLSVEAFKDISKKGLNIVFTMQEAIVKDEITGSVVKGAAIHGKLVKELPAYFEVVVHTYNTITGDWCATTLPKQGWPAKTRLGKGAEYKNPTAKQIFGAT